MPDPQAPRTRTIGRRQRYLLPAVAVAGAVIAALTLVILRSGGEPALAGTELDGRPAPDFTLTDYRGQVVSLSDFRGKVVVLTFIYTNCPDVCPATARNLQTASAQLSEEDHERVALVAITVDPERDTAEALRAFSERHGLDEYPNWYALRGDPATLAPIWQAHGVYPGMSLVTPAHERSAGHSVDAGGGQGHTDAVYLIDQDGRQRVLMRSYLEPATLLHNIDAMLE